ncbi:tRNA (adenosine(37)-N6)-threonylcarbamoyltransferase complex ATPase subunit type 1 TsaE [Xylocopilactobacillus apis]|uniref:tRNA threonylcarbamoyladenosine biosynthesis protein TsaE n=2 Tax=Xylocopilactobacillus apis TaxID=2932183 RepID=A0AAU9CWV6_9LACO|nr:tRNA (adenosine(37)-N6)-threonylcarbamoyltransferase complex ATPase subunit type 1 TsaE [Xylocopilactobacillus apis]
MEIKLSNLTDTNKLGTLIAQDLKGGEKIFLVGDLGAGKTTLTQQLARSLDIKEIVNSPTFMLVKEYHSGRLPLIHLDLYRLKNLSEEDEEMVEEYDDGQNVLVIEWGEQIIDNYPDSLVLYFSEINGDKRVVDIKNSSENLTAKIKKNWI